MPLRLGATAPDFSADTTEGPIQFHDWIGDGWALMFSHPKDFTPVCTTELGTVAGLKAEFDKRNVKVIGLSVDSVEDHLRWSQDIEDATGNAVNYPMIGDPELVVSKLYDMLPESESGVAGGRTAADNMTVRNVYIIGPDKKIKLIITYPMTTGRNFAELLRVIDSIQLTASHKVATPANWNDGDDCIIVPSVSDEEAKAKYPDGWKALKPYLRLVKQPRQLVVTRFGRGAVPSRNCAVRTESKEPPSCPVTSKTSLPRIRNGWIRRGRAAKKQI